jgi:diacylglycerol kinase (ATP)
MKDLVVLVNPASNNGSTARAWPDMRRILSNAGLEFAEFLTTHPLHATELARDAAEQGCRVILYVGGDGTANEVANGIMQVPGAQRPALAALPRGTGGDFPKGLGLTPGPQAAAERILRGQTREVDVVASTFVGLNGQAEPRYYLNIADAGIGGGVSERVNRSSKRFGGFASFLWSTLASVATYRNPKLEVVVDGVTRHSGKAATAVVANGPRFGGGMMMAPRALQDDGLLDVIVIGDISKPDLLYSLPRLYKGTHLSHPLVRMYRGRDVVVESPEAVPLEIDGEYPGVSPFHAWIEPLALRVMV